MKISLKIMSVFIIHQLLAVVVVVVVFIVGVVFIYYWPARFEKVYLMYLNLHNLINK